MARTQHRHWCRPGLNPWSGNEDPASHMAQPVCVFVCVYKHIYSNCKTNLIAVNKFQI